VKEFPEYTTDFAALANHLDICLKQELGPQTWLGRTQTGLEVVIKCGPGAGADVYDFLIKCNSLYPSFHYPRLIAAEPGFYLLYSFIPGDPLNRGEFESAENLAAAFELSGRVSALYRSLKLATMFQGLQSQAAKGESPREMRAQHLAALGHGLDYRMDGLAIRRWEASQSYAWAQAIVEYCAGRWPVNDSPVPWEALRQRVEAVTSIHLTVQGSNLAHTCFTPEHVLTIGKDQWGLVGWQVAPRPYNYMRYRYLAWCLIHTPRGEVEKRYRLHLQSMPTIHRASANSVTFALSLLETWVNTGDAIELRSEKLQAVLKFIDEALTVPVEDKAEPWKN
jgi:hypothetical protein